MILDPGESLREVPLRLVDPIRLSFAYKMEEEALLEWFHHQFNGQQVSATAAGGCQLLLQKEFVWKLYLVQVEEGRLEAGEHLGRAGKGGCYR